MGSKDIPIADLVNRGFSATVTPAHASQLPATVELLTALDELDCFKRVYAGIRASWGLDGVDIEKQSHEMLQAAMVGALSGFMYGGANLEAISYTFVIRNVSRGFTHQLVRHRFMAFGQEGTRETDQSEFDALVPPTYAGHPKLIERMRRYYEEGRQLYKDSVAAGIPIQDASYHTPKGLLTDITVHTNLRALMEFVQQRASNQMHWEINKVAKMMATLVRQVHPVIGLWLVPTCEIRGQCQSHATLFPPCGKMPLRPGQSATHTHLGNPFPNTNAQNPAADPDEVKLEAELAQMLAGQRAKLIERAKKKLQLTELVREV